jgi:hypothetical protein
VNPIVVVLLLALIGLLGAQLTFARRDVALGPQISIAIGLPFLFVGFALGPHLLEILSDDIVDRLNPLLALGLGWIGVLFGLQLDRDHLRQFPTRYLALAWLQAAVAFGIVFLIGYLLGDRAHIEHVQDAGTGHAVPVLRRQPGRGGGDRRSRAHALGPP